MVHNIVKDRIRPNGDCQTKLHFSFSHNGLAVSEPRQRLGEGRKPKAGHGRVMHSWRGLHKGKVFQGANI